MVYGTDMARLSSSLAPVEPTEHGVAVAWTSIAMLRVMGRRSSWIFGLALALLALAFMGLSIGACGGSTSSQNPSSIQSPSSHKAVRPQLSLVALGDSDTTGNGDQTGEGWVKRYAALVAHRYGVKVTVKNLAFDGQTSAYLLADVRRDRMIRAAIHNAQIVVLGIGGAELNAGDKRLAAHKCRAEQCYAPVLQSFGRNISAIAQAVQQAHGSSRLAFRAITIPNALTGAESQIPPFLRSIATQVGAYQAKTERGLICRAVIRHKGRCIDVPRAFNGPSATENAYVKGLMNKQQCCYPSAKGQQLIAQLLLQTGLAPLRWSRRPGNA